MFGLAPHGERRRDRPETLFVLRDSLAKQDVQVLCGAGADRHDGDRLIYGVLRYRPRVLVYQGTRALKDEENLRSRALDHERARREMRNVQRL